MSNKTESLFFDKSARKNSRNYFRTGEYGVWLFAGALSCCLILVGLVMALILIKGFGHFIPKDLYAMEVRVGENSRLIAGEVITRETIGRNQLLESGYKPVRDAISYERILVKTGNREYGSDFVWVVAEGIIQKTSPLELSVIERREYGNFYGYPVALVTGENSRRYTRDTMNQRDWSALVQDKIDAATRLFERAESLKKEDLGKVNYAMDKLRLKERRLELERRNSSEVLAQIKERREELRQEYATLAKTLDIINQQIGQDILIMRTADNRETSIALAKIIRLYQTNRLGPFGKTKIYTQRLFEFITGEPRESNTEGGIFPAIFGTVMLVLLMTIFVLPLGVIAAIYLYLYAKQNRLTRIARISVNNLAGVPSIVYGMFGLGFFVYTIGGSIDNLFYPESLPSPTFGSGGILWASLTLALLTLPVVIVATEEGLTRIPRNIMEGSMALGATRFETLMKIAIPVASPAIMTGMILAIARATGEVAPLMLVGAVKLAPSLPLDGNFPFIHVERKFMHLGFHIFDIGFQSPNIEAARPLVYATAALLITIIIILNSFAVYLRNRLREKFKNLS